MTPAHVTRISKHAARRYCQRVMHEHPTKPARERAVTALHALLLQAVEMPGIRTRSRGDGLRAYHMGECIGIVRDRTLVTLLTFEQYERSVG